MGVFALTRRMLERVLVDATVSRSRPDQRLLLTGSGTISVLLERRHQLTLWDPLGRYC
jgi:hypothetical protein